MRDMKALDIDAASWEGLAADRTRWGSTLNQHLKTVEEKLMNAAEDNRIRGKERSNCSNQRPHIDATSVVESIILFVTRHAKTRLL